MFQADLTASYDVTQEAILMQDTTDYVSHGQASHTISFFNANSFYRIQILKPDSSVYSYSNQYSPSVNIPSANLNIFDQAYILSDSDISGNYVITLYSVPTWNIQRTYNIGDNDSVFYNGSLWACNDSSVNSEPVMGNPDWILLSSYNDLNSKYYDSVTLNINVIEQTVPGDFNTSFVDSDGILGVSVDDDCGSIVIEDNSNYNNDEAGHSQSDFSDYRFIRMTKPTGEYYYFSSVEFDDININQVITPASSGSNTFHYLLDNEVDKDGVYVFEMCNYPTWNSSVTYTGDELIVVYHNGELYRYLSESSNREPGVAGSEDYWELYELTNPEDEYSTRYCTCTRIAVLCLNTYKCYQLLVRDAFCAINEDFCNDDILCKNKKLLNAVKLRMLIDHIGYSVNRQAWNEVEQSFNLIYKICGCR